MQPLNDDELVASQNSEVTISEVSIFLVTRVYYQPFIMQEIACMYNNISSGLGRYLVYLVHVRHRRH